MVVLQLVRELFTSITKVYNCDTKSQHCISGIFFSKIFAVLTIALVLVVIYITQYILKFEIELYVRFLKNTPLKVEMNKIGDCSS